MFSHFRGTSNIGYLKIKKNDLILSAQNLHLGNANVNLLFEHGIISPAYKVYELNKCDQYFVQSWVKKDSTKDFFLNATTEGASQCRKNIDWCILNNQLIAIPSLYEQIRLGKIFHCLNHLITLHQSKSFGHILEAIVSCTLSWEQRKLGEVTTSFSGGTPNIGNHDYYGDEIPFIRSGEINNCHTDLFITEKGLVNSSAAMVKEGDILYALYGATSGEVSRSKLKGAINQAILAILPKAKYDSEYIAQWLKTKKRYIVDTYLQGGQGNLSGNIVKNFIVDFSSYNEQLNIGNFASSLDHLITLHQLEPFQLIFKAIAYRIIDYAKSKPPSHRK